MSQATGSANQEDVMSESVFPGFKVPGAREAFNALNDNLHSHAVRACYALVQENTDLAKRHAEHVTFMKDNVLMLISDHTVTKYLVTAKAVTMVRDDEETVWVLREIV